MERISFEDATLVTQAKVTINGTDYEVTPATYSGGTDLDADTLNYAFQLMHPVGSIYMSVDSTNPAQIFGFGTWVAWGAGRVPVGVDTSQTEFDTVEEIGGEKKHTLTVNEMPSHFHSGIKVAQNYLGSWNEDGVGNTFNLENLFTQSKKEQNKFVTEETGGSQAHNILQPYITCYMWKRTA